MMSSHNWISHECCEPKSRPPTSLIICSRNRPQFLVETVQSVLSGDLLPEELIIIDQSTEPNETLRAQNFFPPECELRYIWSNTIGVSRARNQAIAAVRNELLVFIDDDIFVAPDWFRTIVSEQAVAGPGAVLTGRVLPGEAEVPGAIVPCLKQDERPAVYQGRIGADVLLAGNMSIFRSIFHNIGGYDERLGAGTSLPGAEDNDLCLRLLEAGYKILYVPKAVTYHRAWRNDYLALPWRYGLGQGAFFAKYFSLSHPYMLRRVCWDLTRRTGRLLRLSLRPRHYRTLAGDIVFLVALFKGLLSWFICARRRHGPPVFLRSAPN